MKNCRYDKGTGNGEQVLGNFTFRYLCRVFSVHLLILAFEKQFPKLLSKVLAI
ncbi:hypothetical protein PN492_20170 [Dolichospermum circinale CS-537/01]|uniref:Transposase n=1 Tax=Dolichospermum circinale CS-537/01 TaxID=3021739 RepID=A0ABT5AA42_9CYAN|nr:hypothetical protein [Dolichospermum circinale]MDB9488840.1 hypothetical protein [Dolichospermum circinale CS-537/01]